MLVAVDAQFNEPFPPAFVGTAFESMRSIIEIIGTALRLIVIDIDNQTTLPGALSTKALNFFISFRDISQR